MTRKKRNILLKISGELFTCPKIDPTKEEAIAPHSVILNSVISQIKQLKDKNLFSFVVGGGNFFRGKTHGKFFDLPQSTADEIGMLATIMNGRILQTLLEKSQISTILFSDLSSPQIAENICQHKIDRSITVQICRDLPLAHTRVSRSAIGPHIDSAAVGHRLV